MIRPGDVQRISAGSGITHSDFNPSKEHETHFLQIWLLPNERVVDPAYEQKMFSREDKRDRMIPLVSPDEREGSKSACSDALIYGCVEEEGAHGQSDSPIPANVSACGHREY